MLEVILERSRGRNDPNLAMIRQKLAGAKVFFRDEINARVVTLNSRVVFRVNDGPPKTRVVVQKDEGLFPGLILPITTLQGIALLGLQEGQSIVVRQPDGLAETIRVEHVEYQPEAAMRLARKNASRADEGAASLVCLSGGSCAARLCRCQMAMIQGRLRPKSLWFQGTFTEFERCLSAADPLL